MTRDSQPHSQSRSSDETGVVIVRKRIAADLALVWSFLSNGERFASWIGAFAGGPPQPGTAIDARVGGKLRIAYPHTPAAACGEILLMEPQRRIVFSWGYEDGSSGMPVGSTTIEITLSPIDGGTLVELRHRGIPSEEAQRGAHGGWTHYLNMLARSSVGGQHAERRPAVIAAYYRAWGEADDEVRSRLLAEACEESVRVRTAFAATDSIEELSQHIGGSLRFMPGMTLTPVGQPQALFGFVRSAWEVRGPDGKAYFRGVNVMELSPASRLASVVSFGDA